MPVCSECAFPSSGPVTAGPDSCRVGLILRMTSQSGIRWPCSSHRSGWPMQRACDTWGRLQSGRRLKMRPMKPEQRGRPVQPWGNYTRVSDLPAAVALGAGDPLLDEPVAEVFKQEPLRLWEYQASSRIRYSEPSQTSEPRCIACCPHFRRERSGVRCMTVLSQTKISPR